MKPNMRLITAALSAALLMASCTRGEAPEPEGPPRTLVVYLGGDNNLSDETALKLDALRRGWPSDGHECLIYVDSHEGARLLRLCTEGRQTPGAHVETVREYGAENSASGQTLARVLDEVAEGYPAESYGLIFFSHASGWLPEGTLQNPDPASRSIGADDGTGLRCGMEIEEFAGAIPDGMFDFIILETCLSAGVEVAYELRDKADYLLASSAEIVSPGFTPVYRSALRLLCDPGLKVQTALEAFARAYMDYVRANYTGARQSATLSIIDLREISPLAARIRGTLPTYPTEASDLERLQHFDRPGSYGDYPAHPRFFDLGQWVRAHTDQRQYDVFSEQLKRAVVWEAATAAFMEGQNGFAISHHSGLTTYIIQETFPHLNDAYRQSAWHRAIQE